MIQFRSPSIAVRLRAMLAVLALGFPTASRVHAAEVELFAVTIPTVDPWWEHVERAVGDPDCEPCPCNSGDYAIAPNPTTVYLEAINFQNFTLPAGHVVTNVHADVMCRYDTGQTWDIQIRYGLNGVNDQLLGNFELGSSSLTTCRYRTGAAGNITPPTGGWTAAAVNSLRLKVRQQQGASRLRVKAFRLTVTYVPIDIDGDGTPDINDCAPNDPAIATPRVFYRDLDGDGFGNPGNATAPLCQLNPPAGYVANSSDCNDTNAQINPNTIWYLDADGDLFGDPNSPSAPQCAKPDGYVLSNTDLCPTDPNKIAPGPCGCEVPETDINANGIPDCTESTSILRTVWSTTVPNATGWTNASNAASATQPTCGESCNCDSGGTYASSASTEWLEATDFASMNIPPGYSGANLRVDVQCRADNPSNCTIRIGVEIGSTSIPERQTTFATADGQCRYRLGKVFGSIATPSGGWTASALEAIRVRVRRAGGAANTLRVKSFRVQALLVERDTDHDGLTDSIDPCPTLANGPTDCNGNGLGDTCEIALSPSTRDVNGDGVLDSCQGMVGWIGGSSGSFSTASSWSSGTVPGPTSNLFLSSPAGASLSLSTSAPTTISSLTVASGTVRLNLGANFVVNGGVVVYPGATLILDGVSSNRFFDVAGNLRVRIGAKLEIGSLASVRVGTLGSMVTDPLSTLSVSLRDGGFVPLSIQGGGQFENGIVVKLGSVSQSELTIGRQFPLLSVAALSGPIFRSLSTQTTLQEGKFMRSVVSETLGAGLLAVEVTLQSDFVNSVGGPEGAIGATSVPTALVTRNFNPAPDLLDDIAVCARKYTASGAEVNGSLFVFQSAAAGSGFAATVEYTTGVGPVAIASADLDLDNDMDIAVLNTVSGTLQVFVNGTPSGGNSIDRFTLSAALSSTVSSGDGFLAITRNLSGLKDSILVASHTALIGNSGAATLRAIDYTPAGPVKGNPRPTTPLGPPGPSSPIDDTSRTDGWFASTFRRSGTDEAGALAKVEIVTGQGGLPEPSIDLASVLPSPPFPVEVATADFNFDGFEDALVVGANGPTEAGGAALAIYAGASVGSFQSAGSLPLPGRPLDATVGFFDSDGKSDLLIAFGTASTAGESGEFARLYQNTVPTKGAQPQFESSADDNLFEGAGVRRVESGRLNLAEPDDVAVVGEIVGFTPALLGGPAPYGAARLFEVSSTPPNCIADLTGDSRVDSSDLGLLLAAWGTNGIADLNGDEVIDSADLALVLVAWGECP